MMKQLIKIENQDGIQVIDSRLIANGLNIKHKNLVETIKKYVNDLEDLGRLTFETEVFGVGQPQKYCCLNELQTNFLVTLSRNTPEVVAFKK